MLLPTRNRIQLNEPHVEADFGFEQAGIAGTLVN